MIQPILPSMLRDDFLDARIYPDLSQTLYWTDLWEPELYVALARAGFISIAHDFPDHGELLLPEMQEAYAVLDWKDLHESRHVRRIRRSGRLESEGVELRVTRDPPRVLAAILAYHRPRTWLVPSYRELLGRLPCMGDPSFSLCAVELWSHARNVLVAGELGYTIGRIYTSLSGFCRAAEPEWRDFGTLQLVWLAERLRDRGYAFWNLGHAKQAYKQALGARVTPRPEFLGRWLDARDGYVEREVAAP